jgi:methyl-accepting chemotaxis protein
MRLFSSWRIRTKLMALLAVCVLGLLLTNFLGYRTLAELKIKGPRYERIAQGKDLISDVIPPPENIIEAYLVVLEMLETTDKDQLRYLKTYGDNLLSSYNTRHEYWKSHLPQATADEQAMYDLLITKSYTSAMRFFTDRDQQFIPAVMSGDVSSARLIANGLLRNSYNRHKTQIEEVTKQAQTLNQAEEDTAVHIIAVRNRWLSLLVPTLIALAIVVGLALARSIAMRLAASAGMLSSTSLQMAATVEQQEITAMHQAAAVNETATTMDELDTSFRQTADNVAESTTGLQHSLADMARLREKMETIGEQLVALSEQTDQIGVIISVVGDLANQTNMLALNAAVEAARAGEHGKGFAVVSAEIRKLADESKRSAQRVGAIVEEIRRATSSTVMATEDSAKALSSVSATLQSASDSAHQTLLNVQQQALAVRQVTAAMQSLDAGARETANGLSQTRDGVDSLRRTADDLKRLV